jgi:hypothetical protein
MEMFMVAVKIVPSTKVNKYWMHGLQDFDSTTNKVGPR